jgi:chitinase
MLLMKGSVFCARQLTATSTIAPLMDGKMAIGLPSNISGHHTHVTAAFEAEAAKEFSLLSAATSAMKSALKIS